MKPSSVDTLKHTLEGLEFIGYRRETTVEGPHQNIVDRLYDPAGRLVTTTTIQYHPRTGGDHGEAATREAQDTR